MAGTRKVFEAKAYAPTKTALKDPEPHCEAGTFLRQGVPGPAAAVFQRRVHRSGHRYRSPASIGYLADANGPASWPAGGADAEPAAVAPCGQRPRRCLRTARPKDRSPFRDDASQDLQEHYDRAKRPQAPPVVSFTKMVFERGLLPGVALEDDEDRYEFTADNVEAHPHP